MCHKKSGSLLLLLYFSIMVNWILILYLTTWLNISWMSNGAKRFGPPARCRVSGGSPRLLVYYKWSLEKILSHPFLNFWYSTAKGWENVCKVYWLYCLVHNQIVQSNETEYKSWILEWFRHCTWPPKNLVGWQLPIFQVIARVGGGGGRRGGGRWCGCGAIGLDPPS